MEPDAIFTPGRISWVFFNHKAVVEFLETKPKGWFRETAGFLKMEASKSE